ncbi:DUF3742 family protein [Pseudomonas aeruginosa]|uniref:DUF3742 family protein n=1 Tax=Pseudomonas aeruginosa TaxID=287 RepID=UPI00070FFEF0|nr:DUF3742 family protein [Pseudomonas aeruginosa]
MGLVGTLARTEAMRGAVMDNASKRLAARTGRAVGRCLRPCVRLESAIVRRLVAAGVPRWLAATLKWAVRLVLALGLLYLAFIPALIFLFVLLLANRGGGVVSDEDMQFARDVQDYVDKEQEALKPQWREGDSGWGLYSHDGHPMDVDNPDDYER